MKSIIKLLIFINFIINAGHLSGKQKKTLNELEPLRILCAGGKAFNYTANKKSKVTIALIEVKQNEFRGTIHWDNIDLFGNASFSGKVVRELDSVSKMTLKGTFDGGKIRGWSKNAKVQFDMDLYLDHAHNVITGKYTIDRTEQTPNQTGRLRFEEVIKEERNDLNARYSISSVFLRSPLERKELLFPQNSPALKTWFNASNQIYDLIESRFESRNAAEVLAKSSQVTIAPLNFFDYQLALIRVSDAAWLKKGLAYYFLFDIRKYLNDEENILIRLDGTNAFNNSSDTIAKLIRTNANLGSDNIIDYTHFAFFFNRNAIDNHEIFYIINRYDDPFLVRDKYYLKTLKNRIKPSFVTEERNGFFYIRINFLYQGKLHITTISVKKQTGYFGMQKEGKVIGGFSQRMYAPIN